VKNYKKKLRNISQDIIYRKLQGKTARFWRGSVEGGESKETVSVDAVSKNY
jgi:hypothetical protein